MYRHVSRMQQSPDHGLEPYVIDISQAAKSNRNFHTVIWTGRHAQTMLMSVPANEDTGIYVHPAADQFIYIASGRAVVTMGPGKESMNIERSLSNGFAVHVPAGIWYIIKNSGSRPLKLFTLHAPPLYPRGEISRSKAGAETAANDEDSII